jgi:hypothetical protein
LHVCCLAIRFLYAQMPASIFFPSSLLVASVFIPWRCYYTERKTITAVPSQLVIDGKQSEPCPISNPCVRDKTRKIFYLFLSCSILEVSWLGISKCENCTTLQVDTQSVAVVPFRGKQPDFNDRRANKGSTRGVRSEPHGCHVIS